MTRWLRLRWLMLDLEVRLLRRKLNRKLCKHLSRKGLIAGRARV